MRLLIVRIGSGLLGVIGLVTGALAVYGAAAKLGDAAAGLDAVVLASLDNDFRFYAACWFLIGLALVLGAIMIEKKPDLIQIGLEAVILGGAARLFAFTEFGPLPEFYPAIIIEIVGGIALFVMFKMHTKLVAAS